MQRQLDDGITIWLIGALGLACLLMAIAVGSVAVAAFIALWLGMALRAPLRAAERVVRGGMPMVFAAFAAGSTLWSQAPDVSLRNGAELVVVTAVAITMAGSLRPRTLVSGLMVVCAVLCAISLVFGGSSAIYGQNEEAATGIFTSKNYFAQIISLGILSALGTVLDRDQRWFLRLGGLGALGFMGPLLLLARSAGAILTLGGAAALLVATVAVLRMAPRWRVLVVSAVAALAAVLGAGLLLVDLKPLVDAVLAAMGKNATLTGRTYLWFQAQQLIDRQPLGGYGFQAFWVQNFPDAEALWHYAKITSRAGFHFHNLFYETAVELGYAGVTLLALYWVSALVACGRWMLRTGSAAAAFFFCLVALYMLRAPAEVDFLSPFAPATVLIAVAATYGRLARRVPAVRMVRHRVAGSPVPLPG